MPFIEANGVRIRYRLEGKPGAPVIVFSNSLGTNLSMWDPQVSALRGEFRILRYDTRGHGLSAIPPGPYSQEQLGNDILALLDAVWESFEDAQEVLSPPDWHREIIEDRLKKAEESPELSVPWEEVKARLENKWLR